MEDPTRHLRLANKTAADFCDRIGGFCAADRDDARQEAYLGLVLACQRHDSKREDAAPFVVYAKIAIHKRLLRWISRLSLVRKRARQALSVPTLHDLRPETSVFIQEMLASLHRLPPTEEEILSRHFGLGEPAQGLTEMAEACGITRQAMHGRKERALEKLRSSLGVNGQ